jgi:hypothetical protein
MGKRGRPKVLSDEELKKRKDKREKEWRRKHRKQINENIKRCNQRLRIEVLEAYGGKCACCGETEIKFLSIDHVEGNGAAHRRDVVKSGGGQQFWRWLKKNNYPSGFQVLCHNCNMAKAFYGSCPHTTQKIKTST